NSVVERYAERDPRPISLRQLTSLGRSLNRDKVLVSANFVREELLVRLARRIQDFQQLPFIVGTNPHIAHVYGLYWDAFDALLAVPAVATLDANAALCDLLSALLDSHMPVIPHLAIGLSEIPASHFSAEDVDRFMGAMVFSRIGRRVLGEHHLALTANFTRTWREQQAKHHGASGGDRIVNLRCRADRLVEHCSTMASAWFSETFSSTGIAPPRVVVDGHLHALIACIPSHAEYVLYELLKNSMAHTFKNAAPEAYARWRERRLEGQRELLNKVGPASGLTFRVSDTGGGIPNSVLAPSATSSDADTATLLRCEFTDGAVVPNEEEGHEWRPWKRDIHLRMHHLGLALPMAASFARYWGGGGLALHSMHGYGTDAYFRVPAGEGIEEDVVGWENKL
ncbi:branched-chain alpha-ketoacid dehydrogenase, partial [Zopfochytrium polystomum]